MRSEAGKKGAQAKMLKKQFANDFIEANDKQNNNLLQANDKQNQAIKNQNQIYKKTNTIVLSKKENALEDLATEVSVQSKTTDNAVEQHLDHDTPSSENQSPVSQQKSTEKKTKRSRDGRGCRLPEDFEPDLQYAIDKGLTHDEALLEFERFKNYWLARPSKCAEAEDWQMLWYGWITNQNGTLLKKREKQDNEKRNGGYGNYSRREKSVGERIADNIRNLGSRGFFNANLQNDSTGIPITLESWECIDETARDGGVESL
ncbi:hypothetical protein [Bartonella sp. WD16.2]|uniref:hypothetical protein n=1 Tax=Bartonella sp. WD16.2 TaxID=1933904 RepID=UPI0009C38111|nr:hypothetical protein [Bartonella sp. WD16.2]AQX20181.1 hypothetical protein BWD162_010810 [Bartonella sp. WD16.2]